MVYLNKKNQTDFIRTARLRRIKSEEKPEIRIDLYEAFWLLENDRVTAPPLVIYSDLIETGDSRNMDVASRIGRRCRSRGGTLLCALSRLVHSIRPFPSISRRPLLKASRDGTLSGQGILIEVAYLYP